MMHDVGWCSVVLFARDHAHVYVPTLTPSSAARSRGTDADANMHPGLVQHQHPAQHRYPVWWTGDGVDLEASVESMVDSGVYDFKP